MKVAIIGAGMMGQTHAASYSEMEGVTLVAVCDSSLSRAEEVAQPYHATAYSDLEQLLANEEVQLVSVCLPTFLHKETVIRLAEAGKHVICEKPLALTVEDSDAMIAACQAAGVRLFVGHVVRFFPAYVSALETAKSGAIGRPAMAHLKRYGAYPRGSASWFSDYKLSGGVIVDLMIHDIDFARALFGEPETVYAKAVSREHMSYAQVTLRFAEGQIANITGFWGYPGPFTTNFEITGDGGTIRSNVNQAESLEVRLNKHHSSDNYNALQGSPVVKSPYTTELEHFVQSIRDNTEARVTAEDGRQALLIANAAWRSIESGQPISLEGSK